MEKVLNGAFEVAFLNICCAAVEIAIGILGSKPDPFGQTNNGLPEIPHFPKGYTTIDIHVRQLRVDSDSLLVIFQRTVELLDLFMSQASQIKCVCIFGLEC